MQQTVGWLTLLATKYHVVLESDGQQSPAMFFMTAPSKDVPVSFLFGADFRSGLQARRQMNAMMAQMLAESYTAQLSVIS